MKDSLFTSEKIACARKCALFLVPFSLIASQAAAAPNVEYRAQQTADAAAEQKGQRFAVEKRFYVAGNYVLSSWNDAVENPVRLKGENSGSFDAAVGMRPADNFRLELNYYRMNAEYDQLTVDGNALFLNAIYDARFHPKYSWLKRQFFVPYVGAGAGLSWNSTDTAGVKLGRGMSPALAALAGIALEFNSTFGIDFGYRYIYMLSPKPDIGGTTLDKASFGAHQFRAGVRVSF